MNAPPTSNFEWHRASYSQRSVEIPSARWGHSMTLAKDDLYVFGGYAGNNLIEYPIVISSKILNT